MWFISVGEKDSLMETVKGVAGLIQKEVPYVWLVDTGFYDTAIRDYRKVANLIIEKIGKNDNALYTPELTWFLLQNVNEHYKVAEKWYKHPKKNVKPIEDAIELLACLYNIAVEDGKDIEA